MIQILLTWIFVSIPVGILIGRCIGMMSNDSRCQEPSLQTSGTELWESRQFVEQGDRGEVLLQIIWLVSGWMNPSKVRFREQATGRLWPISA